MGVSGFLAQHGAQAKTHRRVKPGGADAPFLQAQPLGLPVLQEQLAIVHPIQRTGHDAGGGVLVQFGTGTVKEQGVGRGKRRDGVHGLS